MERGVPDSTPYPPQAQEQMQQAYPPPQQPYPSFDAPPPPYPGQATGQPYPPYPPGQPQQNTTFYIPPSATPSSRPPVVIQQPNRRGGANVVVIDPNATIVIPQLGKHPVSMKCPHCHQNIVTNTSKSPGPGAIMCSALLCLFW